MSTGKEKYPYLRPTKRTIRPDIGSFGGVGHDDKIAISGVIGPFGSIGVAVGGVSLVFSPSGAQKLVRALQKTIDEVNKNAAGPRK